MARHEPFNLNNLRLLDYGVIPEAVQREMQRVVADCQDRPMDDRARTVAIVFTVKPKVDPKAGETTCDEVEMTAQVHSSIPKRQTKTYTMTAKHDGTLMFHPDIAEDPEGSTLYDEDAKKQDDAKK